MVATPLPPPPFAAPFLDGKTISRVWQAWLLALWNRSGGVADKVDAALSTANAAAPASAQVVAAGGLQVGGAIGANASVALYVAITDVASLPATGINQGDWAYALNGCKTGEASGSGTGVPVWRSNTGWYAVDSGAVVSA